jgi:Fe2+ or Zn2+ uptake regulation protein
MPRPSEYAPELRSRGFRVTSQRLAILQVLHDSAGHLPPTAVYALARRLAPGITATTVYRNLQVLKNTGLVWETSRPGGHLAYELAAAEHHHLVCRRCGAQVTFRQSTMAGIYRKLERASGYAIDHDHVSLSGLCPECRKQSGIA